MSAMYRHWRLESLSHSNRRRGFYDQVEAQALYEALERDVVPILYDRGSDGLPRRAIARMKASTSSYATLSWPIG